MTTPPPDLRAAGRAFLQKWNDYLDAHPDAESDKNILAAMQRGELPPVEDTAVYRNPIASLPNLAIKELSPLWTTYRRAIDDGFKPKQAVYIAWRVHPKSMREDCGLPVTETELAVQLGSRAKADPAGMFRQWRRRYTAVDGRSLDDYIYSATSTSPIAHYLPEVINVAVLSSVIPGREGFGDRWKVLELAGVWKSGAKGTEDDPVHVSQVHFYLPDNGRDNESD